MTPDTDDTWHPNWKKWLSFPGKSWMVFTLTLPWVECFLSTLVLNPDRSWMIITFYHFSPFRGQFFKKNQEKLKKIQTCTELWYNIGRTLHRDSKKCNSFKSSAYGNYQKFHHQCSLCRISAHLHPLLGVCRDWHPIHLHHLRLPRFHLRSRIARSFTCG